MTLQQLKEAIIKDETEFIIEMHNDVNSPPNETAEAVNEITGEINSCVSTEGLILFFTSRGYDESEAYNVLLGYLIEK
jgi:hypothetical protein